MTIGDKLKSLREKRKMTRQELADSTGISYSYIAKIENGERTEVSLENIEKLSIALKVDPMFFREERAILPQDLLLEVPEELLQVILNKDLHPFIIATVNAAKKGLTLEQHKASLEILTNMLKK